MCHNNAPPPSDHTHTNSIFKTQKQTTDSFTLTPSRRRSRTKTRKPKFLSLRLQLSPDPNHHKLSSLSPNPIMTHQQQLNLFPLHPENLVDDKDMHDDHNVAFLFSSDGDATLNGLLQEDSITLTTSEEDSFSPPSLTSPFDGDNGSSLVRRAMKRRSKEERDGREERWVCYSEVVRKKEMVEEVTSYCSATTTESTTTTTAFGLLSLKLDYEGILNAWSGKGPLYVAGETPQTVPDLDDHVLPHNAANDQVVWGNSKSKSSRKMKGKEEMEFPLGQREASVLRYKEKRQSRLFSKRIRYEVRKLNAEKRPRMKGRFVKRD